MSYSAKNIEVLKGLEPDMDDAYYAVTIISQV